MTQKFKPSLYEIVVANKYDDSNYSVLVLSHEPLTKETQGIKGLAKLKENEQYYYILRVEIPEIRLNPWTEEEHDEFQKIKDLLNN